MTTKTNDACGCKSLCHYDSLTRTQFFHGMLLTDDHLRSEQDYHRQSQRRINRYLWGSGIVCGLEVDATCLTVKIKPGLALDCEGNVIDVCKSVSLDLDDVCKKAFPDPCDPKRATSFEKYLVLHYAEIAADPEPVLTGEDCCDSSQTKYQPSKIREGFCLELVDKCPEVKACAEDVEGPLSAVLRVGGTYKDTKAASKDMKDTMALMTLSPPCPGCQCDECSVCLAKLTIDCEKKTVSVTSECRHYVWSPGMLRSLVCQLLAGADKKLKIPAPSAFAHRFLESTWLALADHAVENPVKDLLQRVQVLESRLKAGGGPVAKKAAPKDPLKPKEFEGLR